MNKKLKKAQRRRLVARKQTEVEKTGWLRWLLRRLGMNAVVRAPWP